MDRNNRETPPVKRRRIVIDLSSDNESNGEDVPGPSGPPRRAENAHSTSAIPDVMPPVADGSNDRTSPPDERPLLDRVLEVFPDVSHAFVRQVVDIISNEPDAGDVPLAATLFSKTVENIANLESYPTQIEALTKAKNDEQSLKARVEAEEQGLRKSKPYQTLAVGMLKQAFPDITVAHIRATLMTSDRLRDAYLSLSEATDSNILTTQRLSKRRREMDADDFSQYEVSDEIMLHARREVAEGRDERVKLREKRRVELEEQHKEREAQAEGQVGECGCCFADDVPLWKMTHCEGEVPHAFCFDCTRRHAESEIGSGRCRPTCMDTSGCKASFADHQLRLCLTEKSLGRLIRLQQQQDLKTAGIEGLEDCPFCDYIAVCHSALVDREFRCLNRDCMKVSCRLCSKETHIPLTCEESATQRAQERRLDARHQLEEAMSDALVRSCNKCKQRFIKIEGCNKMTCSACGNRQCYVCHADIGDYNHFGGRNSKNCPLYDEGSVEIRHLQEVTAAEANARAKIFEEKPDVSAEELNIKVSEEVKIAEAARLREIQQERFHRPQLHQFYPGLGGARQAFEDYARDQLNQLQHRPRPVVPNIHAQILQQPQPQPQPGMPPAFHAQVEEMLQNAQAIQQRRQQLMLDMNMNFAGADGINANPGPGPPMNPDVNRGNPPNIDALYRFPMYEPNIGNQPIENEQVREQDRLARQQQRQQQRQQLDQRLDQRRFQLWQERQQQYQQNQQQQQQQQQRFERNLHLAQQEYYQQVQQDQLQQLQDQQRQVQQRIQQFQQQHQQQARQQQRQHFQHHHQHQQHQQRQQQLPNLPQVHAPQPVPDQVRQPQAEFGQLLPQEDPPRRHQWEPAPQAIDMQQQQLWEQQPQEGNELDEPFAVLGFDYSDIDDLAEDLEEEELDKDFEEDFEEDFADDE